MSTDVNQQTHSSDKVDRRKFIGLATAAAGVMFIKPELVHGTAANSAVCVGLLGCGARGTEDASNLVDAGARVVALGDLFRDQLDAARAHFDEIQKAKGYAAIDAAQLFVGSNAYKEIVASKELDAIVIATPPYYLPRTSELPPRPNAPPAERRLRNWVHDRTLSGDIIVEQNIHVIDICNWILKAHPLKASATGGRQGRPPDDGDAYGNYNVLFHYPDGVDVTFSSTQFSKGWWDVTERFFGTKGTS